MTATMRIALPLALFISTFGPLASGEVVVTDRSALPASLAKIVGTLEKEHECSAVSTACLITSAGVTRQQKAALWESLVGGDASMNAAVGTSSGLALASPASISEAVSTACACDGSIVYYADAVDLSRGEGLFASLAPAMEALMGSSSSSSSLVVVIPEGMNADQVRASLEDAAAAVLPNLVSGQPLSDLGQVFAKISYLPASALSSALDNPVPVADVQTRIQQAKEMAQGITGLSSADLTATRILAPAARASLAQALIQVQQVSSSTTSDNNSANYVANFGELCEAVLQQALETTAAAAPSADIRNAAAGRQILRTLQADLERELYPVFEEQMNMRAQAAFDEFKKALSKLLVSPTLAADMEGQATRAVAAFTKTSAKMVCSRCASWSAAPAQDRFRRQVQEYVAKRLLAARAGGQFRPLPRKGVQVGLHWLLPKPFGNDYRQEPWTHHATDSMVYIPKDKVTDVTPEEVQAGDWRTKVTPSPIGNDMLYMQ